MFSESEIEDGVDFTPRKPIGIGFMKLCKRCIYWDYGCPLTYKCNTIIRWENENMDAYNSDI